MAVDLVGVGAADLVFGDPGREAIFPAAVGERRAVRRSGRDLLRGEDDVPHEQTERAGGGGNAGGGHMHDRRAAAGGIADRADRALGTTWSRVRPRRGPGRLRALPASRQIRARSSTWIGWTG